MEKTEELETIIQFHELAIPSLNPDSFVALENIIIELKECYAIFINVFKSLIRFYGYIII